ncbi:MAG TPA: hypothetical protein VGL81_10725 [Polyangiaceae bacterium]
MTRTRQRTLALLAGLALSSRVAAADVTKAQCIDADTNAQSLRRAGKLAEARATLAVCGDAQCPALVRDDCTRQLDAIAQVQPTIVFDAKDPVGADLSAVRVTVDGAPLAERLDGTALPVDPGAHSFVFEVSGQPAVTVSLVVKEGETGRRERVTVGRPAPKPDRGDEGRASPESGLRRTLGLTAAALGAAGLGAGVVFGVLAASKWSATKADCSEGDCPSYSQAVTDRGATVTDGTIATVSLLVGGALLAGGAALFFTSGPVTGVAPTVGPGTATLSVVGHFQ